MAIVVIVVMTRRSHSQTTSITIPISPNQVLQVSGGGFLSFIQGDPMKIVDTSDQATPVTLANVKDLYDYTHTALQTDGKFITIGVPVGGNVTVSNSNMVNLTSSFQQSEPTQTAGATLFLQKGNLVALFGTVGGYLTLQNSLAFNNPTDNNINVSLVNQ